VLTVRKIGAVPFVRFIAICAVLALTSAAQAESFDTPLKTKVVDFGKSPYSPNETVHIKLTCNYYERFMVKELDMGQKGAEWLAIVPVLVGGTPACTKSHLRHERVIAGREWSGYFKGAKGDLAFFDADDGTNGGLSFAVYDSRTGKRIFKDTAYDSKMWNNMPEESGFNQLRLYTDQTGHVSLQYLRVVATECDLYREKTSCWNKIRNRLQLKTAPIPVCSGYEDTQWDVVSAVAYPVEVSFFPKLIMKTKAGLVKCWPVD
jgi:hypothetical protein